MKGVFGATSIDSLCLKLAVLYRWMIEAKLIFVEWGQTHLCRISMLGPFSQQLSPVTTAVPAAVASADRFCWLCHKDGIVINCETCPRVYHLRCIQLEAAPTEDWVCPECITILHAENTVTRWVPWWLTDLLRSRKIQKLIHGSPVTMKKIVLGYCP
jgi:hypothetical protein